MGLAVLLVAVAAAAGLVAGTPVSMLTPRGTNSTASPVSGRVGAFAPGTRVFSACGDDGISVGDAREGVVVSTRTQGWRTGLNVSWVDGTWSPRSLCMPRLHASSADAVRWGCGFPPPVPVWEPSNEERPDKPLEGIADTHNHMFAEYGFGGHLIWGRALGDIKDAMAPCDGTTSHGLGTFPTISLASIKDKLFLCSDTEEFPSHPSESLHEGFPSFSAWPRWNDLAHHQMHVTWLRKAFDDGLRLTTISLVNNELMCELFGIVGVPSRLGSGRCDDHSNLMDQLAQARKMVDDNAEWMELVLDAAHARRVIGEGRLAVVLSLESSDVLGHMREGESATEWVDRSLQDFYDHGVRSIQLVHEVNNELGGAALHSDVLELANEILSWKEFWIELHDKARAASEAVDAIAHFQPTTASVGGAAGDWVQALKNLVPTVFLETSVTTQWSTADVASMATRAMQCPAQSLRVLSRLVEWVGKAEQGVRVHARTSMEHQHTGFGGEYNGVPLTEVGREAARAVMRKGMLLDSAHLSRRSGEDVHSIAMKEFQGYPVFVSHSPLLNPNLASDNNDYATDHDVLYRVMSTGGLLGLRTGPHPRPSFLFSTVRNDCHGSVKSWLQEYQALAFIGVPLAIGTDFNGVAPNMAPRFGTTEETCAGEWLERGCNKELASSDSALKRECERLALERDDQARAQQQNTARTDTLFDSKGLASVDLLGAMVRDGEAVGADLGGLRWSAERFVRMWERAEAKDRKDVLPPPPRPDAIKALLECTYWEKGGGL